MTQEGHPCQKKIWTFWIEKKIPVYGLVSFTLLPQHNCQILLLTQKCVPHSSRKGTVFCMCHINLQKGMDDLSNKCEDTEKVVCIFLCMQRANTKTKKPQMRGRMRNMRSVNRFSSAGAVREQFKLQVVKRGDRNHHLHCHQLGMRQ